METLADVLSEEALVDYDSNAAADDEIEISVVPWLRSFSLQYRASAQPKELR